MKITEYGDTCVSSNEIFDSLYQGKIESLDNLYVADSTAEQFNAAKKKNADNFQKLLSQAYHSLDVKTFDKNNQSNWSMPDEYKKMDIETFLAQNSPKENHTRLIEEIELFRQHNMIDLLRYLKYLVDTMREHNIVWGVGRGSSVASYCLYIIGVHKIDSIKYNLDIKEFLK
jgi:DNA polymerase III alpha subunit